MDCSVDSFSSLWESVPPPRAGDVANMDDTPRFQLASTRLAAGSEANCETDAQRVICVWAREPRQGLAETFDRLSREPTKAMFTSLLPQSPIDRSYSHHDDRQHQVIAFLPLLDRGGGIGIGIGIE